MIVPSIKHLTFTKMEKFYLLLKLLLEKCSSQVERSGLLCFRQYISLNVFSFIKLPVFVVWILSIFFLTG